MPKTLSQEQLDAAAAQALQRAAEAKNNADRARAEAEQRRQERLDDYDRARLALYNGQQLERDVTEARLRLAAAVRADTFWQAVIDVLAAQHRRYQLWHEASGDSARFGRGPFQQSPPVVAELGFDQLAQIADQAAADVVADELAARDAAREAAAEETQ